MLKRGEKVLLALFTVILLGILTINLVSSGDEDTYGSEFFTQLDDVDTCDGDDILKYTCSDSDDLICLDIFEGTTPSSGAVSNSYSQKRTVTCVDSSLNQDGELEPKETYTQPYYAKAVKLDSCCVSPTSSTNPKCHISTPDYDCEDIAQGYSPYNYWWVLSKPAGDATKPIIGCYIQGSSRYSICASNTKESCENQAPEGYECEILGYYLPSNLDNILGSSNFRYCNIDGSYWRIDFFAKPGTPLKSHNCGYEGSSLSEEGMFFRSEQFVNDYSSENPLTCTCYTDETCNSDGECVPDIASAPAEGLPQVVDFGDNSYTNDYISNVMWMKDYNEARFYPQAEAYCQFSDFAGYGDWRLPTQEELFYLFTEGYGDKIRAEDGRFYWTSDTNEVLLGNNPEISYFTVNGSGLIHARDPSTRNTYTVCVRDEPNLPQGIMSCALGQKFVGQGYDRASQWKGTLSGTKTRDYNKGYSSSFNTVNFQNKNLSLLNKGVCAPVTVNWDCVKVGDDCEDSLENRCYLRRPGDKQTLNVDCADVSIENSCELGVRYIGGGDRDDDNDRDSTSYEYVNFDGTNLEITFGGDDAFVNNSILDLKADCSGTLYNDVCRLCRIYDGDEKCVRFGEELQTDFVNGRVNYPTDFKIRIDCELAGASLTKEFDPFTYGVCYSGDEENEDSCLLDENDNPTQTLLEWKNEGSNCVSETYECPNGCSAGACLPKKSLNDVYFTYTQQGSFDKSLNEILNNNFFAEKNFRNQRFKLAVDVRMLSATNETSGYQDKDFSLSSDIQDYSKVVSINKHNYEADNLDSDVLAPVTINLSVLENNDINDLTLESSENLYLFRFENRNNVYYPGTLEPIRSVRKGYPITNEEDYSNSLTGTPDFTQGVFFPASDKYGVSETTVSLDDTCNGDYSRQYTCPIDSNKNCVDVYEGLDRYEGQYVEVKKRRDVNCNIGGAEEKYNYGNGAYIYINENGKIRFKYETQHPNSRAIFTVGLLACECQVGEEKCVDDGPLSVGDRLLSCDDGCTWTNKGRVSGKCGAIPECNDYDDGGKNYFAKGSSQLEEQDIMIESCGEDGKTLTEYYCGQGEVMSETYECPLGCSEGACLTCEDNDGYDYFNSSFIEYDFLGTIMEQNDYCSGDYVTEWICSDKGSAKQSRFECPSGCENGACKEIVCSVDSASCLTTTEDVLEETEEDTEETQEQEEFVLEPVYSDGTVHYSNVEGVGLKKVCRIVDETGDILDVSFEDECAVVEECPLGINNEGGCVVQSCEDPDFDSVMENFTKTIASDNAGNELEDFCLDDGATLSEAVCDGDTVVYDERICEFGCSNGKCIGETTCTDYEDEGLNYFKKGYSISCIGDDCIEKENESCAEDNIVWESYCNKDGSVSWQQQICSAGCSDGACNIPEEKVEVGATCDPVQVGGSRINPGIRVSKEGTLSYCDPFTLELISVSDTGSACYNDYECSSNICIEGECANIRGELEEQKEILQEQAGLLSEIRCYLRDLLGIEDSEECLAGVPGV